MQIDNVPIDLIVALATVLAVLIAVWELRANAKTSGQTHAREAWMRYLDTGFHNPQFGSTKIVIQQLKLKDMNELWDKGTPETERYWWFLDIMMEAAESLVNYFPEKAWQDTIKYNLFLHKEAICFLWETEREYYSPLLNKIVENIICESDREDNYIPRFPRDHPGL